MAYVFTLPESPRFLLQRAIRKQKFDGERHEIAKLVKKAYQGLVKFNKTELQATRELILIYFSLREERNVGGNKWYQAITELWTQHRTRYALLASATLMFLQQFCGINVLAYYSTTLIQDLPESGNFTVSAPCTTNLTDKDRAYLTDIRPSEASKGLFFSFSFSVSFFRLETGKLTDSSTHSGSGSSTSGSHLSPCH